MTDQILDLDLELDPIQRQVRDRYAEAAIAASTSSSQSEAAGKSRRSPAAVTTAAARTRPPRRSASACTTLPPRALPDAALLASLGCGNPVAVAELREGGTVLDLGSGGGIDVLLSTRRVGPTGQAIGVDMTDEMLQLARRNAAEAQATNVEFRKGTIKALPLDERERRRGHQQLRHQPGVRQGRRLPRDRSSAPARRPDGRE